MASYSITLQAPDGTEETFDCNDDQYIIDAAEVELIEQNVKISVQKI